ncbi:MAG: lipoyl(octanoyl) transferase LipB [Pseudomonadota bacterium]
MTDRTARVPRGIDLRTGPAAGPPVAWIVADAPVGYEEAVRIMERRVADIRAGTAPECVWLLEHPPLYTAGRSAKPDDIAGMPPFPVHATGRGGQFTYHGPGQRVVYVMLDVKARVGDVRAFVRILEAWTIDALARLGVDAGVRDGRVGVWVARPDANAQIDEKIAAIGIRLRRWVSYHGIAINVAPDLTHFDAIVPCGIRDHGVTSLKALGQTRGNPGEDGTAPADVFAETDAALRASFEAAIAPTIDGACDQLVLPHAAAAALG